MLVQKNAIQEDERSQHGMATARRDEPPQYFNAGGMRMMKMHNNLPSVQSSCSCV
jgi:hypothetical protein